MDTALKFFLTRNLIGNMAQVEQRGNRAAGGVPSKENMTTLAASFVDILVDSLGTYGIQSLGAVQESGMGFAVNDSRSVRFRENMADVLIAELLSANSLTWLFRGTVLDHEWANYPR